MCLTRPNVALMLLPTSVAVRRPGAGEGDAQVCPEAPEEHH